MIGQNESLIYLIPLALEELGKNILAEGDLYEGDLLTNVLKIDADYWIQDTESLNRLQDLLGSNKSKLELANLPQFKELVTSF
jgi:hypothetical protein